MVREIEPYGAGRKGSDAPCVNPCLPSRSTANGRASRRGGTKALQFIRDRFEIRRSADHDVRVVQARAFGRRDLARAEHDDREVGASGLLPQVVQQCEPVDGRCREIEQHGPGRSMHDLLEGLAPIRRFHDAPALGFERRSQMRTKVRIAIHHQHIAFRVAQVIHDLLQLVPSHGLVDVVGRAEAGAEDLVVHETDDHDRDSGEVRVGLQLLEHRPSVDVRHHHIERDGPRVEPPGHLQPVVAVGSRFDGEVLPFEEAHHQVALGRIVVDHQHGLAARGRARLCDGGLFVLLLGHDGGETQRERRALPGRALDHDVAAEQPAEGPRDGETEAGPAEPAGRRLVGLREALEQPAQLFRRHADPRVDDPELQHRGIASAIAADLEGQLPVLGEFRGIAQEVEEALPQLDDVGLHRADIGRDLHDERIALLADQSLHGGLDFADQSRDLDPLRIGVHAPGLDLGKVEDIVDEAQEVAGIGLDLAEIAQQARFAKILDLLLHHLAVSDDGGERGAELVAHIGQEGALGAVGRLGRLLGDLSLLLGGFRLPHRGRERRLAAHQRRVRLVQRREIPLVLGENAA